MSNDDNKAEEALTSGDQELRLPVETVEVDPVFGTRG
jgi:hypothetical protein